MSLMVDMLSQEEIDALLSGGSSSSNDDDQPDMSLLTADEKDALGEVGNISMGTAATTLFTLLSQKVTITTPKVSETTLSELTSRFSDPCVTINIQYKVGIEGVNLLIINQKDVKIITDLMMGGDGTNTDSELNDLHLSAIGEAMNQMIGSSSTSLSEMLGKKVDISPPEAIYDDLSNLTEDRIGLNPNERVVMISFRMTVGDLIDSEIMQLMPIQVAKQLVSSLMGPSTSASESVANPPKTEEKRPSQPAAAQPNVQAPMQPEQGQVPYPQGGYQQPQYQQPQYQQPMYAQPMYQDPSVQRQPINAQNVQFESFDGSGQFGGIHSDISLIRDVPLEITVELGRTNKKISEILDFATGTVIELDRLVGESLNILANGKIIAKGEVVVVDENYGVRITEIVVAQNRLNSN
jgi:flagellar motor switch protein FliN/FliY